MSDEADFRVEHDSMGEVRVPADARWRAQTQRAVENFPVSGLRLERAHIEALARIKAAAARVNAELGIVDAGAGRRHRRGRRGGCARRLGRALPDRHLPDRLRAPAAT